MEFKKKTLANGLTIVGEVSSFAKSAAVGFFTKTGARDETAEVSGVSHFLEHMLFKGTDKLGPLEVNQAFDRTGAQYNAFTSEENTVYYAAVLPEYLTEVMELWSQLMRPALRDEDFNLEKNVIKEEIAMYKDMPSFDVMDRGRALFFGDHPCGNSVLGTVESIDALTAEQMRSYFDNRYSPNNVVLAMAGNFDFNKMSSLVEELCGKWQSYEVSRSVSDYPGQARQERLNKANLSREHVCLISPSVSMQDERRFAASMLAMIVGDSVGSRFFWELVDKAIAETATMQCDSMDGTGAYYSYIRCSSENLNVVLEKVAAIFETLASNGVTPEELTKARNKILSAMVIKNEIPMGRLVSLGFNWTYLGEYRSIAQDVADVKAVTVDEVNSIVKDYNPACFTRFTLGPGRED